MRLTIDSTWCWGGDGSVCCPLRWPPEPPTVAASASLVVSNVSRRRHPGPSRQRRGHRAEAIGMLLDGQIGLRNNRRCGPAMRSCPSRLRALKTLAQFDFAFRPGIEREQIGSLHGLGFVDCGENVILLGRPGQVSWCTPLYVLKSGSFRSALVALDLHVPRDVQVEVATTRLPAQRVRRALAQRGQLEFRQCPLHAQKQTSLGGRGSWTPSSSASRDPTSPKNSDSM